MPNLLAHYLLAKRFVLKEDELKSKYPHFLSFIEGNFDYFSLGAQGPDPLFYVGIVPKNGLHLFTARKKLGNRLHNTDARAYFKNLVEECYRIDEVNGTDKNQKRFMAFVLGQFSHYLLDKFTHPYILYKSGFNEEGKIKGKYHYLHAHFEAEIDVSLANKYRLNYFFKAPTEVLPDRESPLKLIDDHLVPVVEKTLGVKRVPKKLYSNGLTNMRAAIRFVNRGTSLRAKLFGNSSLAAMRLPKKVTDDVLNENRELWLDPVTGAKHNESFMELHSRAFSVLQELYENIMKNGFNFDVFDKYIDGVNYYGTALNAKWTYQENPLPAKK